MAFGACADYCNIAAATVWQPYNVFHNSRSVPETGQNHLIRTYYIINGVGAVGGSQDKGLAFNHLFFVFQRWVGKVEALDFQGVALAAAKGFVRVALRIKVLRLLDGFHGNNLSRPVFQGCCNDARRPQDINHNGGLTAEIDALGLLGSGDDTNVHYATFLTTNYTNKTSVKLV